MPDDVEAAMAIEIPYNAHFELSPAGHVALARSCGDGWWEEWVCVYNREWRRLAELLLDGRASCVEDARPLRGPDRGSNG
jgi:hypothetical protein